MAILEAVTGGAPEEDEIISSQMEMLESHGIMGEDEATDKVILRFLRTLRISNMSVSEILAAWDFSLDLAIENGMTTELATYVMDSQLGVIISILFGDDALTDAVEQEKSERELRKVDRLNENVSLRRYERYADLLN